MSKMVAHERMNGRDQLLTVCSARSTAGITLEVLNCTAEETITIASKFIALLLGTRAIQHTIRMQKFGFILHRKT